MCPMFGYNLAVVGVYGRDGVSVLTMRAGVLLVRTSLTLQPYNTCVDCRMSEAVSKKKSYLHGHTVARTRGRS